MFVVVKWLTQRPASGDVAGNNDGRGGGQVLPRLDSKNSPISYKEYDVNPYQRGVNRGSERVVIGSDGSSYYTKDHYRSFDQIQ